MSSIPHSPHQPDDGDAFTRAEAAFLAAYPAYAETAQLDTLRATDYRRIDQLHQTYLDFTGGGVYAESQLRQHMDLLLNHVYGNPHSFNLTSMAMTELVEQTRAAILAYYRADPDEYVAIYTPNATGALKLVGESYPFRPGGRFLACYDNHNSVNGIREFAHRGGAAVTYFPVDPPALRINPQQLAAELENVQPGADNLFAFPAQSNFSGVQHPLTLIAAAQARGWHVLLDAAAFTPTNRLDLSRWHPDFVSQSFYKIFGYPTGVGCLLARKEALDSLRRPWYAGGTVSFTSVMAEGHYLTPGAPGFEDGTLNYLSIPAVEIGLRHIESIGIDVIHTRVMCLTGWLLAQLNDLQHENGRPLIELYGPRDTTDRGATIQFNLRDRNGELLDGYAIEQLANKSDTSLRTGCHCNPGSREIALGMQAEELAACYVDHETLSFEQFLVRLDGMTTGAIRVSLGLVSNFRDVYRFVTFLNGFRNKAVADVGTITLKADDFESIREVA